MADAKNTTTVGGGALFSTPDRPSYEINENDKVTKYFSRPVRLTLPDYTQRSFAAGVQEIPAQFGDDPWLKANGMTDVPNSGPLPPMMLSAQPGSQAFARSVTHTTGLYDAALVPRTQYDDEQYRFAQDHAQMAGEAVRQAEENLEAARRVHASAVDSMTHVAARLEEQRNEPRTIAEQQERDRQSGGAPAAAQETAQEKAAREKKEREATAAKQKEEDGKIVAGLSEKERKDFDKMSDADKEKFLAGKRAK